MGSTFVVIEWLKKRVPVQVKIKIVENGGVLGSSGGG